MQTPIARLILGCFIAFSKITKNKIKTFSITLARSTLKITINRPTIKIRCYDVGLLVALDMAPIALYECLKISRAHISNIRVLSGSLS